MELDRWAYINRMRWVHPGEKIMFALGLLVICLSSPSYRICLTVFVVGLGVAWLGADSAFRLYRWQCCFILPQGCGDAFHSAAAAGCLECEVRTAGSRDWPG